MTGPAISFLHTTKDYGAMTAVDNVSLDIAPGSLIALVGTSGSGKSTLLKMVNRLVEPTSGEVHIDGANILARERHELRRSIGYVFQHIGLFPHMTIARNITIGMTLADGKAVTAQRVEELLDLVELPRDFAQRMPDQLSGGQQQRVGVARALATRPGLMLLDEPFGALDPVTRDNLVRSYRMLHQRLELTTIIVTHDMAEALYLADRILVMAHGRIVADASPADMVAGRAGAAAEELVAIPREQARLMLAMEHSFALGDAP